MRITAAFRLKETKAPTHFWSLAAHDPAAVDVDVLAQELADMIVRHRCRGALHHYDAWKTRRHGGPPLADASRKALEAFLKPLGLPSDPAGVPQDHLEGYVGEMLWFFLEQECPSEPIVRIDPPSFKATDPGGDALVIHRVPSGYLMFRLWEMKKCTGASPVSSSIRAAYIQLHAKALEYLARHTTIAQELHAIDPDLAELYGSLVDLWIDAQPQASCGVSVAASLKNTRARCFTTFGKWFPGFLKPVRLKGMLTALDDFSDFSLRVRTEIWRGL